MSGQQEVDQAVAAVLEAITAEAERAKRAADADTANEAGHNVAKLAEAYRNLAF